MFKRILSATLACGLALGCLAQNWPAPDPTVEPPNLYTHKLQLKAYVDSGGYARGVAKVALQANKYLVKRIAKGAKPGHKLAVVFDIDETALSNLPHIIANDYGYVPKIWDDWVAEGHARAIIPVQTVYDTAVRAKIDVFFITARNAGNRASTERNLREVGYDTWTKIYYMPTDDPALGAAFFKTETRRKLVEQGYDIVLNIGDQMSDFAGGYADHYFKLPNPFYLVY